LLRAAFSDLNRKRVTFFMSRLAENDCATPAEGHSIFGYASFQANNDAGLKLATYKPA
jgi:hypothetical protein